MGNRVAFALVLFCGIAFHSWIDAAEVPANWLGGSGNWTDPTRWSTGIVPNNGTDTYDVNIDNGNGAASVVTFPTTATLNTITMQALTIDANDTLKIDFNFSTPTTFNVQGPFTVNGLIQTPLGRVILNVNDPAGVGGSGAIQLNGIDLSYITSASGSLTIGSGVTVTNPGGTLGELSGVIGGVGTLTNRGHIIADGSSLYVRGASINNQGIFEARNGGELFIATNFTLANIGTLVNNGGTFGLGSGGTLDNTGQTLATGPGNSWDLGAGTIRGGTIAAASGSNGFRGYFFEGFGGSGTLDGVTLNGPLTLFGDLKIVNGISGNGTIIIQNGDLYFPLHVTIDTVPASITIRGSNSQPAQGGGPSQVILRTNQGTIRAEDQGSPGAQLALVGIDDSVNTITNAGSLQISTGATMLCKLALSFANSSKLVVDGGGELDVTGNLDLISTLDALEVHPKSDNTAYSNYLFATYTGSLSGIFDSVTPGVAVDYSTNGKIFISGAPVPEPSMVAVGLGMSAGLLLRRGGRG